MNIAARNQRLQKRHPTHHHHQPSPKTTNPHHRITAAQDKKTPDQPPTDINTATLSTRQKETSQNRHPTATLSSPAPKHHRLKKKSKNRAVKYMVIVII
mmetsp:Transcript_12139/g.17572  ORF Transcript_12139/g.17572 Transcript_12139/m.17572 type:complete len:99 (+) Transcript_12139:213-509(+)